MRKTQVEGVGGIFFKARNPAKLYAWYERYLGMAGSSGAGVRFRWRESRKPAKKGLTVCCPADNWQNSRRLRPKRLCYNSTIKKHVYAQEC